MLSRVPWLLSILVLLPFHKNATKLSRPLDTVNLEESSDSCERTGAPVLWLSCEGQTDVCELFTDNSYLSAILGRQGLMFATQAHLRTKKAEGFSPQALHGFWAKIKMKNPQLVVMSSTVFNKNNDNDNDNDTFG